MAKEIWKPGNMLYPLPVVLVTVSDKKGNDNVLTIAWAGTINTNPPMVSISVRKNRFSYAMLEETGEFVINLTTRNLVRATDYCGVISGKNEDKFETMHLTKNKAEHVCAPLIDESPVNIECRVFKKEDLGSHTMYMADVLCVHADTLYMDEKKTFSLALADPIVYSHGSYYTLGEKLGKFGYSIQKKKNKKGK